MNKGYDWSDFDSRLRAMFDQVVKRRIPAQAKRTGFECCHCGRVFTRKHVRWMADGWICRDRCERQNRSAS